jgi:hypothetical protein
VPELPNIQALKPATKKKIMSATVATAKLWSARRHPSDHLVRFLHSNFSVPVSVGSHNVGCEPTFHARKQSA